MLEPLWTDGVPEFSLLWFNEPDFSQHKSAPGSEHGLAAIRNADNNLARVLQALEARGLRDTTDIIVVSDHGFSTIAAKADLAQALQSAGLPASRQAKSKPAPGDILVISNTGSTLVYVIGHDPNLVRKIVGFLQGWPFTGVIFTRRAISGTFALSQVYLDDDAVPDVFVSMRWTADRSKNGTPGMLTGEAGGNGPLQGGHGSLSPFDMHNTLVAVGPHFRPGTVDDLPTGNVDVAPTILWILGLKPPKSMDGRVLTEALSIPGPNVGSVRRRHLEASSTQGSTVWRQYLDITQLNGVTYYDEGNGQQSSK
jgi:arylsulfatase A-like enzyme